MNKKVYVYDLETLTVFTATFIDRDSDEVRKFVIDDTIDERNQLFNFLDNEVSGLISYNGLTFDSQILEFMYRNPYCTVQEIREYATITIQQENRFVDVPEWKLRIPHLDVFKINHFDNKNRATSLKWCEFGMDLPNIIDMPSMGEGSNWTEQVLHYNLNDVIATKKLYERTIPMIELRKQLMKLYNINCLNWSNSKIGSELLLKLYCQKTGKDPKEVRKLRTYRPKINVSDIIFDYISFNSKEFNQLLDKIKSIIILSTKKEQKEEEISTIYKGFEFVYGKGGIHGSINNKIVNSNNEYVIMDLDVSSLYPSIAVVNEMYPEHLGPEFYEVYKNEIVDKRLAEKHKKSQGLPYEVSIIEGFKEAANATYGKSNDIYSWMYDPKYTMTTTFNGQLMLTMLAEDLLELPDIYMIQVNTDGMTVLINRNLLDDYYNICKKWEKLTKLELEFVEYSKMIIVDVNNYIAVYQDCKKKPKFKGRFEYENIPLHKNKSHAIVPLALYKYYIDNIPVEETIINHDNIYDFCGGVKSKKGVHFIERWNEGFTIKEYPLQKVNRYIISNSNRKLIKILDPILTEEGYNKQDKLFKYRKENPQQLDLFHFVEDVSVNKNRESEVEADYNITILNKIESTNPKDYDINRNYYIHQCYKLINVIEALNN